MGKRGGEREKVGRILWVEKAGGNILYIYFELSLWRVSVCMWAVCVVVLVWQCRRVERGKRAGNVLTSSVYCNHLFLIPMFSPEAKPLLVLSFCLLLQKKINIFIPCFYPFLFFNYLRERIYLN
jgi:hypothetical protein